MPWTIADAVSALMGTVPKAGSSVYTWQVWDDVGAMISEVDRRLRVLSSAKPAAR